MVLQWCALFVSATLVVSITLPTPCLVSTESASKIAAVPACAVSRVVHILHLQPFVHCWDCAATSSEACLFQNIMGALCDGCMRMRRTCVSLALLYKFLLLVEEMCGIYH